ncbi:MAG: hypothetical protein QG670_2619 [Thermoproteota archaeon]|nr:hypothetical protein [Thermoproteota archaeon]
MSREDRKDQASIAQRSIEEIKKLLNDPKNGQFYNNILELCKTPISPADLMQQFSSRRGRFSFIGQDAFNALLNLKNQGAIEFIDGKYVTTQRGIALMS